MRQVLWLATVATTYCNRLESLDFKRKICLCDTFPLGNTMPKGNAPGSRPAAWQAKGSAPHCLASAGTGPPALPPCPGQSYWRRPGPGAGQGKGRGAAGAGAPCTRIGMGAGLAPRHTWPLLGFWCAMADGREGGRHGRGMVILLACPPQAGWGSRQ